MMDLPPPIPSSFADLDTPRSPCNGFCTLNLAGSHCVGCRRSLEEIREWPHLAADERRQVIRYLEQRTISD